MPLQCSTLRVGGARKGCGWIVMARLRLCDDTLEIAAIGDRVDRELRSLDRQAMRR